MKRLHYPLYWLVFALERWVLRRLPPGGRLVAAGIVVSAVFGINTHINLSYQIFCFLSALAVTALIAGRFLKVPLKIERVLPRYATAGQPLTYRLRVSNPTGKRFTDLELEEREQDPRPSLQSFLNRPAPGEEKRGRLDRQIGFSRWRWHCRFNQTAQSPSVRMPEVAPHGRLDLPGQLIPRQRGRLDLTALDLRRPEPLGLFKARRTLPLTGSLLVLPELFRLPPVVLSGIRRLQPGGVALASSVGDSEEFIGLRDYRSGDPLRRIHWKSWAKTGKPIVKEYQEEFFVRHALVLDTFGGKKGAPAFESAVSLAASFVTRIQGGEVLLDLMFVGPEAYCFTSGRGLAQTDRMLEILAGVTHCTDKSFHALMPLITQRAELLSACICVLLAWDRARREMVQGLRSTGVPLEVFVVADPGAVADLPPGPMADTPHRFHVLEAGRIQEGLDRL